MDALERVQGILKKITYKPGWVIEAMWELENNYRGLIPEWRRVTLTVRCKMEDVNNPGNDTWICTLLSMGSSDLNRLDDNKIVDYFIRQAIWQMEDHECCEWLKFDGCHIRDPHPN